MARKIKTITYYLSKKIKNAKKAKQFYANQKNKNVQDVNNAIDIKQSYISL